MYFGAGLLPSKLACPARPVRALGPGGRAFCRKVRRILRKKVSTGIAAGCVHMDLVPSEDRPYFKAEDSGRVTCTLNGHTFPATEDSIKSFTSGSRYRRLRALAEEEASLRQYEPLLKQSKNFPDKLFCALTCHIVNKKLTSIEKHMQGKKYRKAKELHARGEHELMEEPDLESSEGEDASIVVTEARVAGGEEFCDAVPSSTGWQTGMEVDVPDPAELLAGAPTSALKSAVALLPGGKSERVRPARPKRIRR